MTVVETVKDAIGLGDDPARATPEQMAEARLPLAYRDNCAGLLIPLNKCRVREYYLPWKCEDERHAYEKCQFTEYTRRVTRQDELRRQQEEASKQ